LACVGVCFKNGSVPVPKQLVCECVMDIWIILLFLTQFGWWESWLAWQPSCFRNLINFRHDRKENDGSHAFIRSSHGRRKSRACILVARAELCLGNSFGVRKFERLEKTKTSV
jgi:hypothetical protein